MIRIIAPWIVLFSFSLPFFAQAKLAATRLVPLRKVAEYWKQQGSREKLSGDQADIAVLARVASETGIAETASAMYTENEDAAIPYVSAPSIRDSMLSKIAGQKKWEALPPAQRKFVKKNRGSLKAALGENSYLWAWAQFQLNDEGGARNTLRGIYKDEFDRVMKLKAAVYQFGHGPLSDAEIYLAAILPLVEAGEARALSEKMKSMKVHVSSLPQSHIVT